jgi:hypothetical protein
LSAAAQFALSDEEVTLLARMAGLPGFPAARAPQLGDAGWVAVGRALAARSILHGGVEPVVADEVAAVLDVVLFAEGALWCNVDHRPGEGEDRAEVLWFAGDAIVRHTLSPSGVHEFALSDRPAIDDLLAAVPAQASPPPAAAQELSESDWQAACADARVTITVHALRGADHASLTVVDSAQHGLCAARADASGAVVLERLDAAGARAQLTAIAGTAGP